MCIRDRPTGISVVHINGKLTLILIVTSGPSMSTNNNEGNNK